MAHAATFALTPRVGGATIMALAALLSGGSRAEAASRPSFPAWVTPGRVARYSGFSGDAEMQVNTRITSRTATEVYATTTAQPVGTSLVDIHSWACTPAGTRLAPAASFQCWVDPRDPTGSVAGPNGEKFSYLGQTTLTGPWEKAWTAGVLDYSDPKNGVRVTTHFDPTTGLIIAHSEVYPDQVTLLYFMGW